MLHRRPRAALLALAASLTATLMAGIVPAAAATETWYVAPPGPIAAGGSGCASPDFTDLQSAVDASGVRDTIVVCDGLYDVDHVLVEGPGHRGLTIVGASPWGATLRSVAGPSNSIMLWIKDTRDITVARLRFQGRADGACVSRHTYLLEADGVKNVDIRANRFVAPAGASLGTCGYENAIWMSEESTGAVRFNLVKDWDRLAILWQLNDEPGEARIIGNSLRYRHTGVTGRTSSDGTAIYIHDGSPKKSIVIQGNRVLGLASAGTKPKGTTPLLRDGIYLEGENMLVRGNVIRHADLGLFAYDYPGVFVRNNVSRGNITDCRSDTLSPRWKDNIGAAWKSDPFGLCSLD